MTEAEQIIELLRERDRELNSTDMQRITELMVTIPLEDHDTYATVWSAIAEIVNAPDYAGDLDPIDEG